MTSTRKKIEEKVKRNPGISFTELKDEVGRSNGVIQYHIRKSGEVERSKGGLLPKDYCKKCRFRGSCGQRCKLKEMRNDRTGDILRYLSEGRKQKEIAEELSLDKSTVSYHVKKLREMDIVEGNEVAVEYEDLV